MVFLFLQWVSLLGVEFYSVDWFYSMLLIEYGEDNSSSWSIDTYVSVPPVDGVSQNGSSSIWGTGKKVWSFSRWLGVLMSSLSTCLSVLLVYILVYRCGYDIYIVRSRKAISLSDISLVNLMVGCTLFKYSMNLMSDSFSWGHIRKMSSILLLFLIVLYCLFVLLPSHDLAGSTLL